MEVAKLVEENIKLVYHLLHKHHLAYDEEAISVAMEGLLNAANTYDDKKNIQFSTYASVVIYNSLNHYLRSSKAKKRTAVIVSINEIAFCDTDVTIEDTLGDDSYSPEVEIGNKELRITLQKAFKKIFDELPNQASKDIIRLWQKSDYTATQVELASATGVSQAHVSRTLSAFRHKLKKEMEEYLC